MSSRSAPTFELAVPGGVQEQSPGEARAQCEEERVGLIKVVAGTGLAGRQHIGGPVDESPEAAVQLAGALTEAVVPLNPGHGFVQLHRDPRGHLRDGARR